MKLRHAAALALVGWSAASAIFGLVLALLSVVWTLMEMGQKSASLGLVLVGCLTFRPAAWSHVLLLTPDLIAKSNALEDRFPAFFTFGISPLLWAFIGLYVGFRRNRRALVNQR